MTVSQTAPDAVSRTSIDVSPKGKQTVNKNVKYSSLVYACTPSTYYERHIIEKCLIL